VINIDDLYLRVAATLPRAVATDVRAPDSVIEEACQVAWSRLVAHQCELNKSGSAFAWLVTTAVREALRQIRRGRSEVSLDELIEDGRELSMGTARGPEDVVESRERINLINLLPHRQQRMLWLQALGLSYEEMAEQEGCTARTVERQLTRGRAALAAAA
jgi:RNA polymerase sigma factor (sigma-70 family)